MINLFFRILAFFFPGKKKQPSCSIDSSVNYGSSECASGTQPIKAVYYDEPIKKCSVVFTVSKSEEANVKPYSFNELMKIVDNAEDIPDLNKVVRYLNEHREGYKTNQIEFAVEHIHKKKDEIKS